MEEAKVISKVTKTINAIFERYGLDLSDAEYIDKPEWSNVLKASAKARVQLGDPPTPSVS